jgi:hypothetical protein
MPRPLGNHLARGEGLGSLRLPLLGFLDHDKALAFILGIDATCKKPTVGGMNLVRLFPIVNGKPATPPRS